MFTLTPLPILLPCLFVLIHLLIVSSLIDTQSASSPSSLMNDNPSVPIGSITEAGIPSFEKIFLMAELDGQLLLLTSKQVLYQFDVAVLGKRHLLLEFAQVTTDLRHRLPSVWPKLNTYLTSPTVHIVAISGKNGSFLLFRFGEQATFLVNYKEDQLYPASSGLSDLGPSSSLTWISSIEENTIYMVKQLRSRIQFIQAKAIWKKNDPSGLLQLKANASTALIICKKSWLKNDHRIYFSDECPSAVNWSITSGFVNQQLIYLFADSKVFIIEKQLYILYAQELVGEYEEVSFDSFFWNRESSMETANRSAMGGPTQRPLVVVLTGLSLVVIIVMIALFSCLCMVRAKRRAESSKANGKSSPFVAKVLGSGKSANDNNSSKSQNKATVIKDPSEDHANQSAEKKSRKIKKGKIAQAGDKLKKSKKSKEAKGNSASQKKSKKVQNDKSASKKR